MFSQDIKFSHGAENYLLKDDAEKKESNTSKNGCKQHQGEALLWWHPEGGKTERVEAS